MFKFLILSLLAYGSWARPQAPPAGQPPAAVAATGSHAPAAGGNITFLKNDREPLDGMGSYKYDIELSDGTKLSQEGHTEAPGAGENETSIVIKGAYSYIAPDGTPVSVMYIANKDGYQPTGDVIPKAGTSAGASKSGATPAAAASSSVAAPAASSAASATPVSSAPPATSGAASATPVVAAHA